MKLIRLERHFFARPTLKVSRELLGKYLVRKIGEKTLIGKIVETEAYIGPGDKASHACHGRTERCKPMYGPPGIAYVYFIYGMYWMLNIVTEKEDWPCAVLVRALEPIKMENDNRKFKINNLKELSSGPGRLSRWLKIDGSFNGEDLIKSKRLFVCKNNLNLEKKEKIITAKRIGIDYAGEWAEKPWRFYLDKNIFVSRK